MVLSALALAIPRSESAVPNDLAAAPESTAPTLPVVDGPTTTLATTTSAAPNDRNIIVRTESGPLVGQSAPPASFVTFSGEQVSVSQLFGQPVVLNFFASWCPACREELPQLGALSAVLFGHVTFLAVAVHDDPAAARAMIESAGKAFIKAGADRDDAVASRYLVIGAPGTVVIGPDGVVSAYWRGPVPQTTLLDFLRTTYPDAVIPAAGSGASSGG